MSVASGEGDVTLRGERTARMRGYPSNPFSDPHCLRRGHGRFMSRLDHSRLWPPRTLRCGVLVSLPFFSGCAAGLGSVGAVGPALDAAVIAVAAASANGIPETARLTFDWSLREPNLNVRGEGVARVRPPDHARLDLFLGGGSSVLAVALVADDLRAPPGAPRGVIPSPPLLWASFGIFRPGDDAVMLGAEQVGERVRLRYRLPDSSELHYHLVENRIVGVEMFVDNDLVHQVDLKVPDPTKLASESTYRNHLAFRELSVTVSLVESVESFPDRTWSPGR